MHLTLHLESVSKKTGLLVMDQTSKKVSVLHRNIHGDCLIHDGKSILMVKSQDVRSKDDVLNSDRAPTEGERLFEAVKSLYSRFLRGESLDAQTIQKEFVQFLK